MRAFFALAFHTFRLAFRRGMVPALVLLAMGSVWLFFVLGSASRDLVTDYPLRFRFALWGLFAVMVPALLWMTVFSYRADVEGRQLLILWATPLSHAKQFVARWLGATLAVFLPMVLGILFLNVLGTLHVNSCLCERSRANFYEKFGKLRVRVHPYPQDHRESIQADLEKMRAERVFTPEFTEAEARAQLIERYQKMAVSISGNSTASWRFPMPAKIPADSVCVELRYWGADRHRLASYIGTICASDGTAVYTDSLMALPYHTSLWWISSEHFPRPIPSVSTPGQQGSDWVVRLTGRDAPAMVFDGDQNISLSYSSPYGNWNLAILIGLTALWVALCTALALALSTSFPLTLASLLSIGIVMFGVATPFFQEVLTDLQMSVMSSANYFWSLFMQVFLVFMRGFSVPPVIESVALSEQIMWGDVSTWLLGGGVSLVVLLWLGARIAQRREVGDAQNNGEGA